MHLVKLWSISNAMFVCPAHLIIRKVSAWVQFDCAVFRCLTSCSSGCSFGVSCVLINSQMCEQTGSYLYQDGQSTHVFICCAWTRSQAGNIFVLKCFFRMKCPKLHSTKLLPTSANTLPVSESTVYKIRDPVCITVGYM